MTLRTSCPGQVYEHLGLQYLGSRSVLWKAELPTAHFPFFFFLGWVGGLKPNAFWLQPNPLQNELLLIHNTRRNRSSYMFSSLINCKKVGIF